VANQWFLWVGFPWRANACTGPSDASLTLSGTLGGEVGFT